MKKIIILLVTFTFIFTSCTDEFDQSPSSSLSQEDAVKTTAQLNTALNGVYSTLVSRWAYAGDMGLYADGKGGDVYLAARSFNHFQPVVIFQTDEGSGFSGGMYQIFSYVLARTNNILTYVDGVTDKDDNIDAYNDYVGQLYALRALAHFEMARYYAQIPVIASDINAANSGIVILDQYYSADTKFKRSTLKETYDFIIADFKKAMTLLSQGTQEGSGKLNYWAAQALLSRVYLYYGDYNNALSNAMNVINNSPYDLYTIDEYLSVWKHTGTSESLFEVLSTDLTNAQRNSLGYYTSPNGYPEAAASTDFSNWLLAQTDDIRSQTIALKSTTSGSYKAYYTTKYEGLEGSTTPLYVNNLKVIRLSELYLIAAEAVLKGGTASGAQPAVWYYNQLRKNRIESYVDATSVTIDDLLDERRREFFCENQRMFDLVRNMKNINSQEVGAINYNDYRILVAIPERELNISPELVQNPQY